MLVLKLSLEVFKQFPYLLSIILILFLSYVRHFVVVNARKMPGNKRFIDFYI